MFARIFGCARVPNVVVISDGIPTSVPPSMANIDPDNQRHKSPFSSPSLSPFIVQLIVATPKLKLKKYTPTMCLICINDKRQALVVCEQARTVFGLKCFICVCHADATEDAVFRQNCFLPANAPKCNMVTCYESHIEIALQRISQCLDPNFLWDQPSPPPPTKRRTYTCPLCKTHKLSEDGLWVHYPLYHVNHQNVALGCPICSKYAGGEPLPVHIHNHHGPISRGVLPSEDATGTFSLGICRRPSDGKFLMVQEFANSGFWLIGGQANKGESCRDALIREAKEESGVDIAIRGLLDVKCGAGSWRRVVFYCEPVDEKACQPKTVPDFESAGAVWVLLDEMNSLNLRSQGEVTWFGHVANGGAVMDLVVPTQFQSKFSGVEL
eukprot:c26450_g1_i1.p1 GENE.c26450_g1_i1~~c26450_g1_i1.p1  ORF type:complete len:390 (+),score=78.15 c26450_g1_i1:25-1170(+)